MNNEPARAAHQPRTPIGPMIDLVEALEPRLALDATFASAGLYYQPGSVIQEITAFSTEGVLSSTLAATGARYRDGSSDREFEGNLGYGSITNLADGRFERTPPEGFFGEPGERNGARFLDDDSYPLGWWFGQYTTNSKELELLVERTSFATASDFLGNYRFSMLWNDTSDDSASTGTGRLTISSSQLAYAVNAGTLPYNRSAISSVSSDGLLKTARSEYVYLSRSESTLVWADMDAGDRVVSLGVAVRETAPIPAADMAGGFLLAWNDSSAGIDFRQLFLDLEPDGDYKFYNLDEYDDGKRDSIERGFWSVSGSTLTLEQADTGRLIHFTIGEDGKALVAMDRQSGSTVTPAFGVGTRALPNGPTATVVFPVGAVNQFGRGSVYELDSDKAWFVTDLVQKAGGPTITGKIVAWTDPKDNLTYAAGLSDQGLVLYSSTADHQWSFRVLTTEASAPAITHELQAMIGPDGLVHLTGLSATGELLRHYQTGSRGSSGQWNWAFHNISATDLAAHGLSTPAFTGLVDYATAWNGLNVAGLDSSGTIWSVWWSPGLAAWTVSDLTTTYSAVPLVGGLTVYLTPWQGINIAGIDNAGHLQVSWWVPSLGGTWNQNDLTDLTSGPLLTPSTVTSYTSSWGGLNVAGLDSATGDLFVYWWSPGADWSATSLTAAVPEGSPRLTGPLTGLAAPDASLNVFGYNTTHFIRYFWEPGGSWATQDLSAIATAR